MVGWVHIARGAVGGAPWVHIRYLYEKNIFNYHKKTIFPVDTSQGVTPKTHNTKLFPPPQLNTQNSK